MTKLKTILAVSIIGLVASGIAMADAPCKANCKAKMENHKGGKHMIGGANFIDLNLSDAQKAQLKAMREDGMKNGKQNMNRGFTASQFYTKNGFDQKGFINQMNQMNAQRTENMAHRMEQMYAILTPEQKVKFVESMKKMEAKRLQNCNMKR